MTKTKNRSWTIAILLIGMILSLLIGFFPKFVDAHAETNYFSAEQYTESDRLLQADGTLSANRRIQDFANDVKKNNNQFFPELEQVVPLEYLETTDLYADFAYNGKEYGFYLFKEHQYFDLLLIDFIYEFDDENHTVQFMLRTV